MSPIFAVDFIHGARPFTPDMVDAADYFVLDNNVHSNWSFTVRNRDKEPMVSPAAEAALERANANRKLFKGLIVIEKTNDKWIDFINASIRSISGPLTTLYVDRKLGRPCSLPDDLDEKLQRKVLDALHTCTNQIYGAPMLSDPGTSPEEVYQAIHFSTYWHLLNNRFYVAKLVGDYYENIPLDIPPPYNGTAVSSYLELLSGENNRGFAPFRLLPGFGTQKLLKELSDKLKNKTPNGASDVFKNYSFDFQMIDFWAWQQRRQYPASVILLTSDFCAAGLADYHRNRMLNPKIAAVSPYIADLEADLVKRFLAFIEKVDEKHFGSIAQRSYLYTSS
jgi:hypothetical protein